MTRQAAVQGIRERYNRMAPHLNEKQQRLFLANEAKAIGSGGITVVHESTGIAISRIRAGIADLDSMEEQSKVVRRPGGGRKSAVEKDETLIHDIEQIVSPFTRGHPENPLLWCSKSTQNIADTLNVNGHRVTAPLVARLLKQADYSLQSNKKTQEGQNHPDRDAQFCFINDKTIDFQKRSQPVISVDCKKKENIGNFKNNGQEHEPKGMPTKVSSHDFALKETDDRPAEKCGRVVPYGIYDCTAGNGFVNVGVSSETAEFAVNSLRVWWNTIGREYYPLATEILIAADCGGGNSNRTRLWKLQLQQFSNETGLTIHVVHFPPGTSKWNKIEHKMFCYISKNWRGRPLVDRATVINLIGHTKTKMGFTVQTHLDENTYKTGIKISDEDFSAINLTRDSFHGEWNYSIAPNV